ncbi:helix-turn-helix domain-containing protein [Tritonibacter mobilis]|uniref:helix-turn-helix domain-containing protein n=1 Tax=Tritonibacter mobilis TaxID=379347 RepID=UPI0008069F2F|nr:helix-turn-helix domain-containing protein [Tritonibacter mobilis]
MSNECAGIAQKRRVGSATKKIVLMYLADRASDDGSGIWTSKAHIAADTELSKRSVQNAMQDFEQSGLLVKTGTKPCKNGYTYEYRLVISVLKSLPGTRDETGESPAPVHHVHLTGESPAPQDVHHVHPNHPITIHEPSITPKPPEGDDDLFSADNQTAEDAEGVKAKNRLQNEIEQGFAEFWKQIWPNHFRKTGKADCLKVYTQACTGKHAKAQKISPQALNAATRAYIRSVSDQQYLKGPLPWLRQPGWEPFVQDGEQSYRWDDLKPAQKTALADGRCPPSMLENGEPNAVAAHWLAKMRRAS